MALEVEINQQVDIRQFVADYRTVKEAMQRIGIEKPLLIGSLDDE
jgi:hypothetical protein